jgi:peptide chain release factor 3
MARAPGPSPRRRRPPARQIWGKFLDTQLSSLASDLDGAPVFMASSAFSLRYEQERRPKIAFADVKDYQKAAA